MQDNTVKKRKYVSRYVSKFSTDRFWQEIAFGNRGIYICIHNCIYGGIKRLGSKKATPQENSQPVCGQVYQNYFEKLTADMPRNLALLLLGLFVMKQLRTVDEVCEYLRISRTVLYRMEKDFELLPYRYRGKVFYDQKDLDEFLDSRKQTAPLREPSPIAARSKRAQMFASVNNARPVSDIDKAYRDGAFSSELTHEVER